MKFIKENKRDLLVIMAFALGGLAGAMLDYQDRGFGIGVFAWPVFMLGVGIIPTVRDILKKRKLDKNN